MGQTQSSRQRRDGKSKKSDDAQADYVPAPVRARPCLEITALFIIIVLVLWAIYSNVIWVMTRSRLDYHRYCIDANEHRVLPPRNLSSLIEPPPFSYGYFAIDYSQLEARWKLYDVLDINQTLSDISLRGPLTATHPYVAEVAFAMGVQKDSKNRYFAGVEDMSGTVATDVIERPYAYYVSFEDDTGYEIARDALDKTCYSNL